MLLSNEQMKQLKQVNVSKDTVKTKERLKADFSAASNATKQAIIELSGQGRHSFYRAFDTGSANARIVLAMAQVLNVQPWYYTGVIADKEPLDREQFSQFLKTHGYNDLSKLISTISPKRKPGPKPKDKTVAEKPAPAGKKTTDKRATMPTPPPAESKPEALLTLDMSKEEPCSYLKRCTPKRSFQRMQRKS